MQRSIFICLLACLAAAVFAAPTRAADKAAKSTSVPAPSTAAADAREHVHQALLAETLGDNLERSQRLAKALLCAPDLPEANWNLGRVQSRGKWLEPRDVEQAASADPRRAEYQELRAAANGNAKLLRNLARWCLKAGWDDVAQVHFAQLLGSEGADAEMRDEAIRRLGLRMVAGKWVTGREFAAQEYKAKVIEEALAKFRPRFKTLQLAIDGEDDARRETALKELEQLNQPEVIPVLESFLVDGGDRFQEAAVKQLAKLPHCEASEGLARYAVLSPYVAAGDLACAALRSRSAFEYCPLLLAALNAPLKSQFQIAMDRGGTIVYVQAVQRNEASVTRTVVAQTVSTPVLTRNLPVMRGAAGRERDRLIKAQEVNRYLNAAKDTRLKADLVNANNEPANRRIMTVLARATGAACGADPANWWEWWQEHNQSWWPKTSEFICREYRETYELPVRTSCFVAGTLVRTEGGLRPVETVLAGDRVLSQNQDTGELTYKVVKETTVRPPAKIRLVRVGAEEIRTTLAHPFWVSGLGWKMAKDLNAGDRLHGLHGSTPIENIVLLDKEEQAFNLVVDDFNTYFVGQAGLLVHDNEFRKPTRDRAWLGDRLMEAFSRWNRLNCAKQLRKNFPKIAAILARLLLFNSRGRGRTPRDI